MGIIDNPQFDFDDLSDSSRELVSRYLSDASEQLPAGIRNAILDVYNDLRYTMHVVTSTGQSTSLSMSSCDDFIAQCVPEPLVKAPFRFNLSRANSESSRPDAASGITSLRVHSIGLQCPLRGRIPIGVKKSDSVIDPDSPSSSKGLSSASHSSFALSSPSSPLRYSFSTIESEEPVSMTTEHQEFSRRSGGANFMMQLDGTAEDDGCASRRQYPTWLYAQTMTITPIKQPMLLRSNGRQDFELQMDGVADYGCSSNTGELDDLDQHHERLTLARDPEHKIKYEIRQTNLGTTQEYEEKQKIPYRKNLSHLQSPTFSYDATTTHAEAEPFDRAQANPTQSQFQLKRGRDNDSHYETQLDPPEPDQAPPLPTPAPAIFARTESGRYVQQKALPPDGRNGSHRDSDLDDLYYAQRPAPTTHPSPENDNGPNEKPKPSPHHFRARQEVQREAQQNSFEMQNVQQHHLELYMGKREGYFDDQIPSDYEAPPLSPTVVDHSRRVESQSRVDLALRRGTPIITRFPFRDESSRHGQRSSPPYNAQRIDELSTPTSPHQWYDAPDRPETALSQGPTVVNPDYHPDHLFSPRPRPRTRGDSHDSSNGLRYDDSLPKMRMSSLNRSLVWLLGDPTFDESVELWKKIHERLESGDLKRIHLGSAFEDDEPTLRMGRMRERAIGRLKRKSNS